MPVIQHLLRWPTCDFLTVSPTGGNCRSLCVTDAETKAREAAQATTPGSQSQNANSLEPAFSTPPAPVQTPPGMGSGPSRAWVGMDMAHWGPAAGPHGQRGLGGERTGQGAGGRQGLGSRTQKPLLSAKVGPWGRIPPVHRALQLLREPPAGNGGLAFPSYLRPAQNAGSLLPAQPPRPSGPGPPGSPRFNIPSSVKTPPGTCPAVV